MSFPTESYLFMHKNYFNEVLGPAASYILGPKDVAGPKTTFNVCSSIVAM